MHQHHKLTPVYSLELLQYVSSVASEGTVDVSLYAFPVVLEGLIFHSQFFLELFLNLFSHMGIRIGKFVDPPYILEDFVLHQLFEFKIPFFDF